MTQIGSQVQAVESGAQSLFSKTKMRFVFPATAACILLGCLLTRPAAGQEPTPAPAPSPTPAQPTTPATAPEPEKHVGGLPILRNADENSWLLNLEYYAPLPGFNRNNRDIDVRNIRFARAWHFSQGWEIQLGAVGFRATGTRTAPSVSPNPPLQRSGAFGMGIGPTIRWNFLQFPCWRLFAEATEDLIYSTTSFPAEGTSYNGYFRGGGGASFKVSELYWLETSFHWAHVSNGRALSENPIWNGRGFSIGVRRTLQGNSPAHQAPSNRKSLLPFLRGADEKAWITSFDYFAPQPGYHRLYRDIDVEDFRVNYAWHYPRGWEFQFGGFTFRASGTRDNPAAPPPFERSDALGAGFGPLLRWNALDFKRWRIFGDLGVDLIVTNNVFPAGGTHYDFFLHGGAGTSFKLNESNWLETSFHWTHISNGQGYQVAINPTWQGYGLTVGLRHTLGPSNVESQSTTDHSWLPITRMADENAWVTNFEYFGPLENLNHFRPDMNVRDFRVARVWHFSSGFEFQLGGLAFPRPIASGFGPLFRWNFLQTRRWRVFVDGEPDLVKSSFFFIPRPRDEYEFYLRGGVGTSLRIHRSYWLEASGRWAHISNSWGGSNADYPSWSGLGASVGLRHTFR